MEQRWLGKQSIDNFKQGIDQQTNDNQIHKHGLG
jgi:hypothetical protein